MSKARIMAALVLLAGLGVGSFVYNSETDAEARFSLKWGLDLAGGTHLVYSADVSQVAREEVPEAMQTLRDVIERRVNLFGVSEPIVQTERGSVVSGEREHRLIIELPGVTDTQEAIAQIGETPELEFKLLKEGSDIPDFTGAATTTVDDSEFFNPTGLTGRYLESADLQFGSIQTGSRQNEPIVLVHFNTEGGELFETITTENVGRSLGIFLDGALVSVPTIIEPIPGGEATISGNFTADEARELVRNLNFGALPLPIELRSVQTIGASLGDAARSAGVVAGLWGLGLVVVFMLLWYRLPGLLATVSLAIYMALMLAIFKLVPVTLTAAGIAGFILSIGMAVDANVLIFERMKEGVRAGLGLRQAVDEGFARAWTSIRDGNLSSIITAIILFWFGSSLVEGFALVFGLGVIVSMLTAITVSRTFLLACTKAEEGSGKASRWLFGSGITRRLF